MTKIASKPAKAPAKSAKAKGRGAEWPPAFYLGREVRDRATGVTGTCLFLSLQPTGMWMIGVQPKAGKEGAAPEAHMYDEPRIEIVGPGLMADAPTPLAPEHAIGEWVKHRVSPLRGVVMSLHWSLNGCVTYNLASAQLDDRGRVMHQAFLGPEIEADTTGRKVDILSTATLPTGGLAQRSHAVVR